MSNSTNPTAPATPASRIGILTEKAKSAQSTVETAIAEDRQKLSTVVADAKDKAAQGAQRLQDSGRRAKAEADGTWNQVQTSWQEHVTSTRSKIGEHKAERDLKRLRHAAADAEEYAAEAIVFAIAAIQEAEYATLDAILVRAEADEAADSAA